MKTHSYIAAICLLSGLGYSHAEVTYGEVLATNQSAAGVRAYDAENVILTGSLQDSGTTLGLVWKGSLQTGVGQYYTLNPDFAGQTVTTSLYYGPNTSLYDPTLGAGNVRFVGSYKYSEGGLGNHGLIYTGALTGGGTWQEINVPSALTGGTVANTIPHSTMGNLVVGNYDLTSGVSSSNAFVYNIASDSWTLFDLGGLANLTSAYGIWQNGIGSDSYTIVGGSMHEGLNKAFLINYNTTTQEFGEAVYYAYGTGLTHFEGITGVDGGYNLIATTEDGATFGFVPSDGETYGEISWTVLDIPDSTLMTANTVVDNIALGVYSTQATQPNIQTYTATVPEPSVNALLAASASAIAFAVWRRRRRPAAII
jgi:hypothetical protein